jgi:hypothetical protein
MLESEVIDKLSANAERFFFRLMLRADDYGRYHAHPQLLRSNLFPLKSDIRSSDVSQWLTECEAVALVRTYESDSKRFLEIPKFNQRVRSDSKFPRPPWGDGHLSDMCQTTDSNPPPYSESESEANSKAQSETNATVGGVGGVPELKKRISAWFRRKPETAWAPKEIKALHHVEKLKTPPEDLGLLESYYTAVMPDPDRDYRRRDIATLLNNWPGEIDRARAWKDKLNRPIAPPQRPNVDYTKGF